jgi:hypothetical protein
VRPRPRHPDGCPRTGPDRLSRRRWLWACEVGESERKVASKGGETAGVWWEIDDGGVDWSWVLGIRVLLCSLSRCRSNGERSGGSSISTRRDVTDSQAMA